MLTVWKEAMRLAVELHKLLKECKDYGFRDQLQRASISVPSNIAEGFERQTNKEYIQFLFIAKGSCAEMRTQLYLAKELGYISSQILPCLLDTTKQISAMLVGLIKARQEKY